MIYVMRSLENKTHKEITHIRVKKISFKNSNKKKTIISENNATLTNKIT